MLLVSAVAKSEGSKENMKHLLPLAIALFALRLPAQDYTMDFKMNHPDGIYRTGETIVVSAQLLEDGKPVTNKLLRYVLSRDVTHIKTVDGPADAPVTIETTLDHPGWCKVLAVGMDQNKKMLTGTVNGKPKNALFDIGAMVDPLDLKQGAPTPEDFAAFWERQKAELKRIPMDVKYKPVPSTPEYRKVNFVTINCGEGIRPVEGIMHIPANAKPKSLPILLHVHGAGVHNPSDPQWAPPIPGGSAIKWPVIFFNLNAHGIPNDQPKSFYTELREGELKAYPFINSTNCETYYMKGMILRLIRALEFLKTLPEWNGKDIVVGGGSQGGAQALFAAGADSQVTEIYADVPAMCDHGGTLVDRQAGWPGLYFRENGKIMVKQDYDRKNAKPGSEAMVQTAGYFDAANFARQIRCKTYIRTGGVDGVCPPTSVFAAYNAIPSTNKEIDFAPLGAHCSGIYDDTETVKVAKFRGAQKLTATKAGK